MKELAAKSVLMKKLNSTRNGQNSTKRKPNNDEKNTPFLNIDGINFGSDDYYNEFYDGEFDLVDDAVISYQEQA